MKASDAVRCVDSGSLEQLTHLYELVSVLVVISFTHLGIALASSVNEEFDRCHVIHWYMYTNTQYTNTQYINTSWLESGLRDWC